MGKTWGQTGLSVRPQKTRAWHRPVCPSALPGAVGEFGTFFAETLEIELLGHGEVEHDHALAFTQLLQADLAPVLEADGVAVAVHGGGDLGEGHILDRSDVEFVLEPRGNVL